jgi:hypothetical protein
VYFTVLEALSIHAPTTSIPKRINRAPTNTDTVENGELVCEEDNIPVDE